MFSQTMTERNMGEICNCSDKYYLTLKNLIQCTTYMLNICPIKQLLNEYISIFSNQIVIKCIVVDVMKMRNTLPRAGIKPTSLAFWANELPLHHIGSLMTPLYPHLLRTGEITGWLLLTRGLLSSS